MNRLRRPALFAYLCALLALAFAVSGSAGSLAIWVYSECGSLGGDAARAATVQQPSTDPTADVGHDDDENAEKNVMSAPVASMGAEEEERDDDPVPEPEPRLVQLSEDMGRLVVWERPDSTRPVTDAVDETSCPPPRS